MMHKPGDNLLDNAAKYGGWRVEVTDAPGEVTISDNGPGIPAEEAQQADSARESPRWTRSIRARPLRDGGTVHL
jgi:signal transduction histidine kinase